MVTNEERATISQEFNKREHVSWAIFDRLIDLIIAHSPGCIVEIGMGYSTIILYRNARWMGQKLYSCDENGDWAQEYYQGEDHILFKGRSEEFIKKWDEYDVKPAVVFIDGEHRAEVARMEFNFFAEKLVDNGIIFIHDTLAPFEEAAAPVPIPGVYCGDIYILRKEIERQPEKYDCFSFPYLAANCGLTMVRKKKKDLPFYLS